MQTYLVNQFVKKWTWTVDWGWTFVFKLWVGTLGTLGLMDDEYFEYTGIMSFCTSVLQLKGRYILGNNLPLFVFYFFVLWIIYKIRTKILKNNMNCVYYFLIEKEKRNFTLCITIYYFILLFSFLHYLTLQNIVLVLHTGCTKYNYLFFE